MRSGPEPWPRVLGSGSSQLCFRPAAWLGQGAAHSAPPVPHLYKPRRHSAGGGHKPWAPHLAFLSFLPSSLLSLPTSSSSPPPRALIPLPACAVGGRITLEAAALTGGNREAGRLVPTLPPACPVALNSRPTSGPSFLQLCNGDSVQGYGEVLSKDYTVVWERQEVQHWVRVCLSPDWGIRQVCRV